MDTYFEIINDKDTIQINDYFRNIYLLGAGEGAKEARENNKNHPVVVVQNSLNTKKTEYVFGYAEHIPKATEGIEITDASGRIVFTSALYYLKVIHFVDMVFPERALDIHYLGNDHYTGEYFQTDYRIPSNVKDWGSVYFSSLFESPVGSQKDKTKFAHVGNVEKDGRIYVVTNDIPGGAINYQKNLRLYGLIIDLSGFPSKYNISKF